MWVYSIMDYSGILFRLTKSWGWETPLGTPPSNYKSNTNAPPATVAAPVGTPAK
jgi:uncharacterized membrane protein YagU involved in acid resistance